MLALAATASAQEKKDFGRPAPVRQVPSIVQTITGNPLTILVGDDTSFQVVNSAFPGQGQIYPGWVTTSTGYMGVFLNESGTLFGPFLESTPWTPVSISSVTGSGTEADPFRVVVVVSTTTGVQMTMTVTYVNGQDYFRKLLTFTSPGATSIDVFVGADIYLIGSDSGIPILEPVSGSPGGSDCSAGTYKILFIPITPAQRFSANGYWEVWSEIQAGSLSNAVAADCQDNGAALQWQGVNVPAGGSASIQAATSFGTIPTIAQFRVDTVTPNQGTPGQSLNVEVTGIGFEAGTTFDFGAGITVGTPTINSAISATVPLTIAGGAALGARDVTGTQSGGGLTSTLTNGFSVVAPAVTTIACANWQPEVGIWGPSAAPCGDLTSTSTAATYESASFSTVFTDFSYEVEFIATRPIQPTAANTLFLRGAPTPRGLNLAWNSGYAFGITTTGKYSIFRFSNGRPILVQAWVTPVPPAIINGSGLANTLKVDAIGDTLTFSINGTPVKTITGQTLLSGRVGLGMVRSVPTATTGPKDTLVVNAATVAPGGSPRLAKGVSAAQERANAAANAAALSTSARPDPLFAGGGKPW